MIALENSFHGRTMGALALTAQPKYRQDFEPMLEGVRFVPRNDIEALRAAMDDKVCGIMLEPIQGEGGIYVTFPEFLRACREVADQHHAALVFDEIQCGMGRTGQLFAFQHFGVMPDVVCIAKPMAAGGLWGRFSRKKISRSTSLPASMAPRSVAAHSPAAWRWSIWRSWKTRTCWSRCAASARISLRSCASWLKL